MLTDSGEWDDSIDDVEAIVRSAGHYVRASDDLRPRVMEVAFAECSEHRAQRCIYRVAVFVMLLASFTTAGRHHLFRDGANDSSLFSAELESSITRAAISASGDGQSNWGTVEAFTNLRQRQAEALRLSM